MKSIFLSFSILILICCNIYNSYGFTDNNNTDFKITKAFADSLNKYNNDSEDVTVYVVTTNGVIYYDLKTTIKREEYGISKECKIVFPVLDSKSGIYIGYIQYFKEGLPSTTSLKSEVDKVIQQYKTRPEAFDNILGLQWGMRLEDAIHKLQEIGLYSWGQVSDTEIMYVQDIAWNGVLYNAVKLSYVISNKQNKYLSQIYFLKICDNAEQAKALRKNIAFSLELEYGKEAIQEKIEDNKFKAYTIFGYLGSQIQMTRINLYIHLNKISNKCGVILWYNGVVEAQEKVEADNNQ